MTSAPDRWVAQLKRSGLDAVLSPAGRYPTEEEQLSLLKGCVGYVAGTEPIRASLLSAASDLRVISRNGSGTDGIDIDATQRRGIVVLRAEGANSRSVAELAIGQMFNLFRFIPQSHERLRSGVWERERGAEIRDRKLAIVGLGAIGTEVARMALCLGMSVDGVDPSSHVVEPISPEFTRASLTEALGRADAISLHIPAAPGKPPLLDSAVLTLLRHGAVVVNTARAALVDSDAMLAALDAGAVGGYATDVFESEPAVIGQLETHPRVIVTPHIGAYTKEAVEAASSLAVENVVDALLDST